MKQLILTLGLACSFSLTAPSISDDHGPKAPTTPVITDGQKLYEDFGKKEGLIRLMDVFMVNLLEDPRTKPRFQNADQEFVKEQLVLQFCQILNGPCKYEGPDMKTSHEGMYITREDFFALVEALQKAMSSEGIPFRSQNKLVAALAPMHRDIVTR